MVVVISADLGRQSESCWNGNPDPAHFGEICALSPEKGFLGTISIGLASTKKVDVFLGFAGL